MNDKLLWYVIIHLTFVVSAVMLGLLDRMTVKAHGPGEHRGQRLSSGSSSFLCRRQPFAAGDEPEQQHQQHKRQHRQQVCLRAGIERIVGGGPALQRRIEVTQYAGQEGDEDAGYGAAGDVAGSEQDTGPAVGLCRELRSDSAAAAGAFRARLSMK